MDKKEMGMALCALSNNEIVIRRKPLTAPLLLLAAGFFLLALALWQGEAMAENLSFGFTVLGWGAIIAGAGVVLRRCFGDEGAPYELRTKSYLRYEELYFPKEQMREVMGWCARGEVEKLREQAGGVPAVVAVLYTSKDGSICACRPFEYVELEYRPLADLRLFRR